MRVRGPFFLFRTATQGNDFPNRRLAHFPIFFTVLSRFGQEDIESLRVHLGGFYVILAFSPLRGQLLLKGRDPMLSRALLLADVLVGKPYSQRRDTLKGGLGGDREVGRTCIGIKFAQLLLRSTEVVDENLDSTAQADRATVGFV